MDTNKIIETLKSKSKVFQGFFNVTYCSKTTNAIFVFGDNDIKRGCKGQAVIRYCENSFGIPTKKKPDYQITSYYTDDEYNENMIKIKQAIKELIDKSKNYDMILFPENGLGTGLSKMSEYAPRTLKSMNNIIKKYFGIDYSKYE